MKAALSRKYGSPDVLSIEEIDTPVPKHDEVLIRVCYSTVNRTDCGFLRGMPFIVRFFSGLTKPKSTILGCELSGEVVEAGSEVTEFKPGDRVVAFKDDDFGFGGHAQCTTMPQHGMIAKTPDHISDEQAAPALEGAHYALFYIRAAGVTENSKVLVNGGTGAIGSAAIQIMSSMGAQITAVCAGAYEKQVQSLGASETLDYESVDFTKHHQRYDFVFDAVGKSTFGKCRSILKENGLYASTELGPWSQNPLLALLTPLFCKQRVLFPLPKNQKADAVALVELMEKRQYTPLIDQVYPLDEIADAYRYVETGQKIGNVLIKIS